MPVVGIEAVRGFESSCLVILNPLIRFAHPEGQKQFAAPKCAIATSRPHCSAPIIYIQRNKMASDKLLTAAVLLLLALAAASAGSASAVSQTIDAGTLLYTCVDLMLCLV